MTSIAAEAVVVESVTANPEIVASIAGEVEVAYGAVATSLIDFPRGEASVAFPIEVTFEVVT